MYWSFSFSLAVQDQIPDFNICAFKRIPLRRLGFVSLRMSISPTIPFDFIQALWIDFILCFNLQFTLI